MDSTNRTVEAREGPRVEPLTEAYDRGSSFAQLLVEGFTPQERVQTVDRHALSEIYQGICFLSFQSLPAGLPRAN
jgi:hypothetical protein